MPDPDVMLPRVRERGRVHDRVAVPEVHLVYHRKQPLDERSPVRLLLERDHRMRTALRPGRARGEPRPHGGFDDICFCYGEYGHAGRAKCHEQLAHR